MKNYAKALLISSLSIIAASCSKDKSAPDSQAAINAKSQANNTNQVNASSLDEFVLTGRYSFIRKADHHTPTSTDWFPSETTPLMRRGETRVSNNGQYALNFQSSDGNLVLSSRVTGAVLWSIKQTGGTYLMFHKDGNLLMHTDSGYNWASDIYVAGRDYQGTNDVYLTLQDDGNLVMEWDGGSFTDVIGSTATGGGINSTHYGSLKLPVNN